MKHVWVATLDLEWEGSTIIGVRETMAQARRLADEEAASQELTKTLSEWKKEMDGVWIRSGRYGDYRVTRYDLPTAEEDRQRRAKTTNGGRRSTTPRSSDARSR